MYTLDFYLTTHRMEVILKSFSKPLFFDTMSQVTHFCLWNWCFQNILPYLTTYCCSPWTTHMKTIFILLMMLLIGIRSVWDGSKVWNPLMSHSVIEDISLNFCCCTNITMGCTHPSSPNKKLFYSHHLEWSLRQCTVLTVCTSYLSKHERITLTWIFKNGIRMGMHLAQDGNNWCVLVKNGNKILQWDITECAHICPLKAKLCTNTFLYG